MGFGFKKNLYAYGASHPNRKPSDSQKQAYFHHEQNRHYTNNIQSFGTARGIHRKPSFATAIKSHGKGIWTGIITALAVVALIALFSAPGTPHDTAADVIESPEIAVTEPAAASVEPVAASTTPACIHSFTPATCMQPATCTLCGAMKGGKAEHTYTDGVCDTCAEAEALVWIPQHGDCYHISADCSNMIDPSEVPVSEAIALGFTPCSHCY